MYLIVLYSEHQYSTLDLLSYAEITESICGEKHFYPKLVSFSDLTNIRTMAKAYRTSPTQVKIDWLECEINITSDIYLGTMLIDWQNQEDVLAQKPKQIEWRITDGRIIYPRFTVI